MRIPLYSIIFLSKVLENTLATLRLIVVANGKKWLGAVLQFIVALVWVFVTGVTVNDIQKDPLKIVFFAFGSFVGSYVGCIIEERLALGSNMITAVIDSNNYLNVIQSLKKENYGVTVLKGTGLEENKMVIMSLVPRKKRQEVTEIITHFEPNAFISAEKVSPISKNAQIDQHNQ